MSGRRSCRTGRSIINTPRATGFAVVRAPLSGAVGGRFAGDVLLPLMGRDLCVEVKCRGQGFRELYSWLEQRDLLIVKADRRQAACRCPALFCRRNCQAGWVNMPRRPSQITQAKARIVLAAKQAGAPPVVGAAV